MNSNKINKITDNIVADYRRGDLVYDEDLKLKYVRRILKNSLKQRHFKSYKFFKNYGNHWVKCDYGFASWLTLARRFQNHGYPELADFCEKRCRRFLSMTRLNSKSHHYHRQHGSISLKHPCYQGQLQTKYYQITSADWTVDYHTRAK